MIGGQRKREVNLHQVAERDRLEKPSKIAVPWTVVDRVVGSALLTRLILGHLANRWVPRRVFPLGSGNIAPCAFSSGGMTSKLMSETRDLKQERFDQLSQGEATKNHVLCELVRAAAPAEVGNCGDNAEAATVTLAALLQPEDSAIAEAGGSRLLESMLRDAEMQKFAGVLKDLQCDGFLPAETELHLIKHAELPDHMQVFVSARKAIEAHAGHEVVVVDPWLLIPLVHLKSDESHGHAYSLSDHPLTADESLGEGTQARLSIHKADPLFKDCVRNLQETGQHRKNALRDELSQSPDRSSWLGELSGNPCLYDGRNWPVRRSYMVRYKENENSEPFHFHDYDLDDYFDKRLKMLLVDHYKLLFEKSDLVELPYTGGAEFSKILDELIDGNASPLIELLRTLPSSEASSQLLTDLLVLGCPDADEGASAIQSLCHHCLTTPSNPDSLSTPMEQQVLNDLMWGVVWCHGGVDMHLLPAMLSGLQDGLNSSNRALAQQRAAACLVLLPELGKDLVRLAAKGQWELRALWSSASAPPDAHDTLREAVTEGHIGGVKLLLNGDWSDLMLGSEMLVSIAAGNRDWQVVQALVDHGAKVDCRDDSGKTALHHAATHGRLIDFVMKAGGDPNVQDNGGSTPVMHATNAKAMRAFIGWPTVDWNLTDQQGNSALMVAMKHKDRIGAALVLAAMDSPMINRANENGVFPLLLATIEGDHSMLETLLATRSLKPNQRVPGGETALMKAVSLGDIQSVGLLLKHADVDVTTENETGGTALSICTSLAEGATDEKTKEKFSSISKLLAERI
jgi:ankyrin repeat protein